LSSKVNRYITAVFTIILINIINTVLINRMFGCVTEW